MKDNICKIMIVDDHLMFREGLKFLLSEEKEFNVIAEAENGIEFLDKIRVELPDVVLMDINMPQMDGVEATKQAISIYPNIKIIVLSMFGDEIYYFNMIQAGAKGFLLKKSGSKELVTAIKSVVNGNEYFSTILLKNVILSMGSGKEIVINDKKTQVSFTEREQEILTLLCKGKVTKEIAQVLNISPRTVEVHKSKIFHKTSTKSVTNLISVAIKNNLVKV